NRLDGARVALERACTGLPATLVHGDLQRKNLYVRNGAGQSALYAIDWETAGWGIPAADLARIDLPTYWSVVRSVWHDVRLEDVRRLGVVGRIFRELVAIRWVSPQLAYDSPHHLSRPISWLRIMHGRLSDAVRELGALRCRIYVQPCDARSALRPSRARPSSTTPSRKRSSTPPPRTRGPPSSSARNPTSIARASDRTAGRARSCSSASIPGSPDATSSWHRARSPRS